jgi:glycine betaine catabolism A
MKPLHEILSQYRPRRALARDFYHDPDLYRAEMDVIWRRSWLFAGHNCQAPQPGDYFVYEVDGDSVIIVSREDGSIGALQAAAARRHIERACAGAAVATERV